MVYIQQIYMLLINLYQLMFNFMIDILSFKHVIKLLFFIKLKLMVTLKLVILFHRLKGFVIIIEIMIFYLLLKLLIGFKEMGLFCISRKAIKLLFNVNNAEIYDFMCILIYLFILYYL
jgi:hypothetical protein